MPKEFFKAHFFPEGFSATAGAHQSAELLPVGVLLQHLPAAAARSRRAADAALHRRGDRRRLLGADLPGGRAIARAATSKPFTRRHRHDRLAARICRWFRSGSTGSIGSCTRAGKWPKPGPVSVTFGAPIRLSGDNYAELAQQVEQAVRDLPIARGKVTQSTGCQASESGSQGLPEPD